jgi:hypothetical protein
MYPTVLGAKRNAESAVYNPAVVECVRRDGVVGYITLPRGWPLSDIEADTLIVAGKTSAGRWLHYR